MQRLLLAISMFLPVVLSTARASVMFTMVERHCVVAALSYEGACGRMPTPFSFTVSDAAIARGSLDVTARSPTLQAFGDVADLIAFDSAVSFEPGIRSFAGALAIHVQFAPDGSIAASSFFSTGTDAAAGLTGSSLSFAGWFDDEGLCQHDVAGRLCTTTGRLLRTVTPESQIASVDEPGSARLLGAATLTLFGGWQLRRVRERTRGDADNNV